MTGVTEQKKYKYYESYVTEDGKIYNETGKEAKVSDGCVYIQVGDKKCRRVAGRVVYEAVSGKKLDHGDVMVYKDGDRNNVAFENLNAVTRKEYFKGYDWSNFFCLTEEQQKEIKRTYRSINDATDRKFTYAELAVLFKCSPSTIQKVIKGTYAQGQHA